MPFVSEAGGGRSEPEKLAGHPHRAAGNRGGASADRDIGGAAYATRRGAQGQGPAVEDTGPVD